MNTNVKELVISRLQHLVKLADKGKTIRDTIFLDRFLKAVADEPARQSLRKVKK